MQSLGDFLVPFFSLFLVSQARTHVESQVEKKHAKRLERRTLTQGCVL
jgi:hypothetical protein